MYYVQAGLKDKIRQWLSKIDKVLDKLNKETESFSEFGITRDKSASKDDAVVYEVKLVNRQSKQRNVMKVKLIPEDTGKYTMQFKLDNGKRVKPVEHAPEKELARVIEEVAEYYYGMGTKISR